ncbi:MAG: hypothetical protein LCH37_15250 [Bacteroidetes bacterium]|nr:hypothetical protein [Bacteroidota bacterium]
MIESIQITIQGADQLDETKVYGTLCLTSERDNTLFVPVWFTVQDLETMKQSGFLKKPDEADAGYFYNPGVQLITEDYSIL